MSDKKFMQRAIELAKKGQNWTNPNPLVGAVIVKDGKIIGEGWHRKYGGPHAEVEAINNASQSVEGATIYVTLIPCCHFGKTPPCTDAIIKSGIKKVVCAQSVDPNPKVLDKSIRILNESGVDFVANILSDKAWKLNEAFNKFHSTGRPFVAIKFASSLDGKIATESGDSKWITSEKSRSFARELRSKYQAILVGKNTVINDDPHLGCRDENLKDPVRIILDSNLETSLNAKVYRDENVIVCVGSAVSDEKVEKFRNSKVKVLKFGTKRPEPKDILSELAKLGIISIFVEGGGEVIGSFVDAGVVDKVYAFQAPMIVGGKGSRNAISGIGPSKIIDAIRLKNVERIQLDDDLLTIGYVQI